MMYLIDSRGHGQSATPKAYHYTDMAEDVARLIRALSLNEERPAVLGFSDGGIQALLLGIHHPGFVSSLIICGANANPGGLKRKDRHEMKRAWKKTGDPRIEMMLKEPEISETELKSVSTPCLILAGEHDCIRRSHTEWIAGCLPHADLKILPGEDHGSYVVHSDRLAGSVTEFLGTHG